MSKPTFYTVTDIPTLPNRDQDGIYFVRTAEGYKAFVIDKTIDKTPVPQVVDWGQILSKPTTLADYGITDAAPASGSNNYIQNQSAAAQNASFRISGKAYIGASNGAGNFVTRDAATGELKERTAAQTLGDIGANIDNVLGIGNETNKQLALSEGGAVVKRATTAGASNSLASNTIYRPCELKLPAPNTGHVGALVIRNSNNAGSGNQGAVTFDFEINSLGRSGQRVFASIYKTGNVSLNKWMGATVIHYGDGYSLDNKITKLRAAFDSNGDFVLIINDVSSSWTYPTAWVNQIRFGEINKKWETGWSMEFVTDISSYTSIVEIPFGNVFRDDQALYIKNIANAAGNILTRRITDGRVLERTPAQLLLDINAQTKLSGTGFVKANGTTISYDNSSYLNNALLSSKRLSDANNITEGTQTNFVNGSNRPTGTDHALLTLAYSTSWAVQLAGDWRTNGWYGRNLNNGTWGSWNRFWHDGDFSSADIANWNTVTSKEPAFSKNSAFNKNFGATAGTVAQGNDTRILNGQRAWSNLSSSITDWNTAFSGADFKVGTTSANGPISSDVHGISIPHAGGSLYGTEIVGRNNNLYYRSMENGTILPWLQVADRDWVNTQGFLKTYTETDPTVPSHVKSIASVDITNWNVAFGWGDYKSSGWGTGLSANYVTNDLLSFTQTEVVKVSNTAANNPVNDYGVALRFYQGSAAQKVVFYSYNNGTWENEYWSGSWKGWKQVAQINDASASTSTTYSSTKINSLIASAGGGDMLKSVYDPNGKNADAFDYNNLDNKPTIPTNNNQLTNGANYITASALTPYLTSSSAASTYIPLAGTQSITGEMTPLSSGNIDLGRTNRTWRNLYAENGFFTSLRVGGNDVATQTWTNAQGFLKSYTETDPTVPAHVKGITTTNISNWNNAVSSAHAPVTIGTANGLSLSGQQISLALASPLQTGALQNTDYDRFDKKQDALSSGINIKTINGQSILGSGNLTVSGVANLSLGANNGQTQVINNSAGTGVTIPAATPAPSGIAGLMSSGDKRKLDYYQSNSYGFFTPTNNQGVHTNGGFAATYRYDRGSVSAPHVISVTDNDYVIKLYPTNHAGSHTFVVDDQDPANWTDRIIRFVMAYGTDLTFSNFGYEDYNGTHMSFYATNAFGIGTTVVLELMSDGSKWQVISNN